METDLFSGNNFILYLLFVVSVLDVDRLNEKQKITIIYICTYGISYNNKMAVLKLVLLLSFMIFMMLEFFSNDRKKLMILKKVHYKLADFLYMGIFQYKLWLVIISLLVKQDWLKNKGFCSPVYWDVFSLLLFILAIYWMFNVDEVFYSFTEIYNNIWKYPYYNVKFDDELEKRLQIITTFEDRLYWEREKSYTPVSIEFFKVWYSDRHRFDKNKQKYNTSIRTKILKIILLPYIWGKKFFLLLKYVRRFLTSGHSTIAMQIMRILSYRHGLVFMNSKVKFKKYKVIKRKVYEVIYSRMFFEGMREYLAIELCNNMDNYRRYLVYLYPHIVQTKIDKTTYAPAMKAVKEKSNQTDAIPPMNEWDIDLMFRMAFGFNSQGITEKRIAEKKEFIEKYGVSELL